MKGREGREKKSVKLIEEGVEKEVREGKKGGKVERGFGGEGKGEVECGWGMFDLGF